MSGSCSLPQQMLRGPGFPVLSILVVGDFKIPLLLFTGALGKGIELGGETHICHLFLESETVHT